MPPDSHKPLPPTYPNFQNVTTAELFANLTDSLEKRSARLLEETQRDMDEVTRIYNLVIPRPGGNNTAGTDVISSRQCGGSKSIYSEMSVRLGCLLEAVQRHKEEGEAIVEETLGLQQMMKRLVSMRSLVVNMENLSFGKGGSIA